MKNIKISEEEARHWAMQEVEELLSECSERELYKDAVICVVQDEHSQGEAVFYAETVEPSIHEPKHIRKCADGREFLMRGPWEQEILHKYKLGEFINQYVLL